MPTLMKEVDDPRSLVFLQENWACEEKDTWYSHQYSFLE